MSKSVAQMLFCACIMFNGSANAFDLNGNWTADDRNCDKVFVKKNNKISMTRNSGVFGGGFIVEGESNQRTGKDVQNNQSQRGRWRSSFGCRVLHRHSGTRYAAGRRKNRFLTIR